MKTDSYPGKGIKVQSNMETHPTTARATCWSLTINNPTPADEEEIARARQKGWKVDGQLEKGSEGTVHYQLILRTPQVRFSAVKKQFTRAHIEVARNAAALEEYVHKEDGRVGHLAASSERYPSLSRFWHLVAQEIDERNWRHWSGDQWWDQAFEDLGYKTDRWYIPRPDRQKYRDEMAQEIFEVCVGSLIEKGYHVEHFFSPPNISVFKKFHFELLTRSHREIGEQTARQTDTRLNSEEENDEEEHNHAISSQEIHLPTLPEA